MPGVGLNALGRALCGFFTDYLWIVRGARRRTVLAYGDSFELLCQFCAQHLQRSTLGVDFPEVHASWWTFGKCSGGIRLEPVSKSGLAPCGPQSGEQQRPRAVPVPV